MSFQSIDFRGQPALRSALPGGDSCTVALHGGQVLSWITADGVERLYLSPEARFDGKTAIRGGVPVCWPQFNQRGPLPKHGFARNLPWRPDPAALDGAPPGRVALLLEDGEQSRAIWPQAFRLRLVAALAPRSLEIRLEVENTGTETWSFTAALHSYLRVADVTTVRLEGLQGAERWDSVRDRRAPQAEPAPAFGEEYDCVYAAPAAPLRLIQAQQQLAIAHSPSCTETVVWNPGPVLGAKLGDMPPDDWRRMLCVEAAKIDAPVTLAPGAHWQAWQRLSLA
jgi:glucose-6-phosphate 1-epimerase